MLVLARSSRTRSRSIPSGDRRLLRRLGPAALLVSALLLQGCRSSQRCCPDCALTPPCEARLPYDPPRQAGPPAAKPGGEPTLHTAAKRSEGMDVEAADHAEDPRGASAGAPSHFAHDPAYNWLVGTVDYSAAQDAWVLRYCSVEENDRYGGVVTLVDAGDRKAFQNGQLVRVEGHLIDPGSRQLRPAFQVKTIRPAGP